MTSMKDANWALNKITWVFKIFAGVAALLGIAFFFIIMIGGGTPEAPRATSFLALVLGFFYFVFFWTIAEVLGLLMRIEANTRND
jgi:hypothetical protein